MNAHRLRVLRWIGAIVPAIGLALLTYVVHFHLETVLPPAAIVGLMVGVMTTGAFIFSHFLFRQIEKSEQELYQRNRELAALHAVSEALGQSLKLDEILSQALERVVESVAAKAASLCLINEANGKFSPSRRAGSLARNRFQTPPLAARRGRWSNSSGVIFGRWMRWRVMAAMNSAFFCRKLEQAKRAKSPKRSKPRLQRISFRMAG